jgi:beta-lactamase regulating signal transducer with metallopeptidase domain/thiol-disulfide isomerase/thioredoxin
MLWLSEALLPADVLVRFLNAALASSVACAIAVVLSRRTAWSLPTRHAMLLAAIVASLVAPWIVPRFHLPTVWAIQVSETFDQPRRVVSGHRIDGIHRPESSGSPNATSIPAAETDADRPPIAVSPTAAPVSVVQPIPPASSREQPSVSALGWARICGTVLCGVWLVGSAVGLGRALLGFARLRRWIQTLSVTDSRLIADAARSAAESVGLPGEIVVYRSNLLPAPVTFGLLRPRIVVPAGIESTLSFDQLRAVLKHELAHIARRDLWIGLLQQLARIMYWWNPLVRLANHQLADLREQICDDIAIRDLAEPAAYGATLVKFAECCNLSAPVPATLGIGASPAGQLERRIRRIVSSPKVRCVRLTRLAAAGVSATVILMTGSMLLAQVQVQSPAEEKPADPTRAAQPKPSPRETEAPPIAPSFKPTEVGNPTLHELIQQMAVYERMYLPFDIKAMETFRFPDDLTPEEKTRNLRADGRKHQRLMEYAQIARRIWRNKETDLVDDEIEQGPYERFSDGERIVQVSPSSLVINDRKTLEYHISNRKNGISNYLHATPLVGVICLSSFGAGELFSEAFKTDEEAVELAWDNGDAKLTFGYGKPHWNTRFVLWLSRAHDWHPIRLQRYSDAKDRLFFDEWEATKFARRGKVWRVVEGTHRYRDHREMKLPNAKIKYSMDFKVLEEKYGPDVDEKQFQVQIPPGAKVRVEDEPEAEPPPPTETREITVTAVDVTGKPIPKASVRLPASPLRDLDVVATNEQGVARSPKAPADNVSVHITAPGFRPVSWIMGNVNELRAIMVPLSPGVAVFEGKPVADAWITNESLQIRADGFTYVPQRDWDGRDKDWSHADGQFELKANLTLRRLDSVVPYIAVDPSREKMAIRFVPAREMGRKQELALHGICHAHGHCLLEGMTESVEVGINLESPTGQHIGFLSTRRELTPLGLRIDYEMRMPPGDYVLKARESSHHAGFSIPVTVPTGKNELDLGTKTVPATGAVALRGRPAPELEVQFRPGRETTWETLRGQVVVLDFWGTWCGPCVNDMPKLMDVAEQFRGKPVQWLSVHTPNLKTFEQLDQGIATCQEKSWNKRTLPFTTVLDRPVSGNEYSGKTSQRFGVAEWPTLIVVDRKGRVVGPVGKNKLAETISRSLEESNDR